jgi:hypothetical protein
MMNQHPDPDQPAAVRDDRISLLRLEKYLLNELSSEERAGMERAVAENPRLASSLAEMQETNSTLDWQGLRSRLEVPAPATVAKPSAASFIPDFRKRLDAWLPNPTQPKLAWAGAFAVLFLLIPAILLPIKSGFEIRAKGGSHAEVVLEIGGSRLAPGQMQNVQAGDILGFSYRSANPIYTQIWYREDGGEPNLFDGRSDSNLFWPASSGWSTAPQRIRLDGDWKVQRIVILASPEKIAAEDARRIILGDLKPKKQAGVFTYDLVRP